MGAAERLSYILQGASLMFFLFASISLFQSEQRSRLKTALAFIVAFFAFGEVKDLIRVIPAVTQSTYALRLLYTIDMWTIGVCASYLVELVVPKWFTLRRVLLMTNGFIIFTALYAITGSRAVFLANLIYVALYSIVMLIYLARATRRYNRFIRNNYSNLERISINWIYEVTGVFVLCVVVWTIYLFNHNDFMKCIYYIISLCAWIMLIARSKRQKEIPYRGRRWFQCGDKPMAEQQNEERSEEVQEVQVEEQSVEAVVDTSQLSEQMKTQLEELMTVREIYLNSHLTLSDLAAELGTNRTYLSNYLNRELKVSFYDYVNSFRVKRACRMIEVDPEVTVYAIVESCGFNSVSTFRRSFSREIGRTYGEYRQNILSQSSKA